MPVPKRKTSRSNTRHRRSQWKAATPTLVTCARCKEKRPAHTGPRRLIVDDLSAILTRVLGEHAAHLRTDTPLRSLGLDPEGWVCLSWALDGRIGDVDLDSVETVGDLRRVIA
jgi:large subunit ribosomal protein L32